MSKPAPDSSPRARTFAPLRAPNASELIVRRIGEAIGSGVLAPGEQLPSELELATMLAVAPMTLRQAIAILREAGLVETRRGKNGGTFVSANVVDALAARKRRVDRGSLRELSDWRRAVSGEAAALAAERIDRDRLDQLDGFAEAARRQADEGFPAFRLADSRFHLAIAEASGSARLAAA
jgi:GntR family transcriptional regulator, transcriptional repressor for pyruvate dehydrogenase complex